METMQKAVNKSLIKDYNEVIPPMAEMWLERIGRKISGGKYTSGAEMLADYRQISENAVAYNVASRNLCSNPSARLR